MPDGFHDDQFPVDIALGSRGGPMHRTEIVTLSSGQERRIARWSQSRRRYEAGYGIRCGADIESVIGFFEAREGQLYAFRFRDPFDHSSNAGGAAPTPMDQPLGTGDGNTTIFQLTKSYNSGPATNSRVITLPVAGSLRIALDGVELAEGADFMLDPLTGEATFAVAPASGSTLTAGYIFDVPVRFSTDQLMVEVQPGGGDIPDIPLIEVRL